jgi:hypothetical protein
MVIRDALALWLISAQAISAFYGCDVHSNEGRHRCVGAFELHCRLRCRVAIHRFLNLNWLRGPFNLERHRFIFSHL